MAIVSCPQCGKDTSDLAKVCHCCGASAPWQRRSLPKVPLMLTIFPALLVIAASGVAVPATAAKLDLLSRSQVAERTAAQEMQAARPLLIRQFDIGQGDAALITTPEGRRILIDAGPGNGAVVMALAREGIDTLDLVVASHNHADHIGGMPMVFAAFVVKAYVENGVPHTTATYRRTLDAIEREAGLQYLRATDRVITIGTVTVRILAPPRSDGTHNNNSVGTLIEYGAFRALYTGDSETPELMAWLASGRVPRVTLVKVAHHGGTNGTTAEWVRATSPAIAIISVGGNSYGHPAPNVEQLWAAGGAKVYRTDRDGPLEVAAKPDGSFIVRPRLR